MTDFHQHLTRQCAVSREKFGPNKRRKGVIAHIEQELKEIQEAQTQADVCKEWADVCILGMDGLLRDVRELLRTKPKHEKALLLLRPRIAENFLYFINDEPTNEYVAHIAMSMILDKQAKNELRDFGNWRDASDDKPINHKRGIHD
jgi:hypothetical protein